jgi:hypothetical protein
MGFHILGKDGESIIKDLNTWKKYASPTSSNHWAEGRSAMEFARAWIKNGPAVPQDIQRIFKSSFPRHDISFIHAYAEWETPFSDTPRGPRNHDLLLEANIDGKLFVIGIEGKEREQFDKTLEKKISEAKNRSGQTLLPARVNSFCRGILNRPYGDDLKNLRYQFLSGIAGTVVEAKERNATTSVFIAHQLISPATPLNKIEQNMKDYETFIRHLLNEDDNTKEQLLYGPFNIPGSELVPSGEVYIGKVITKINKTFKA